VFEVLPIHDCEILSLGHAIEDVSPGNKSLVIPVKPNGWLDRHDFGDIVHVGALECSERLQRIPAFTNA